MAVLFEFHFLRRSQIYSKDIVYVFALGCTIQSLLDLINPDTCWFLAVLDVPVNAQILCFCLVFEWCHFLYYCFWPIRYNTKTSKQAIYLYYFESKNQSSNWTKQTPLYITERMLSLLFITKNKLHCWLNNFIINIRAMKQKRTLLHPYQFMPIFGFFTCPSTWKLPLKNC